MAIPKALRGDWDPTQGELMRGIVETSPAMLWMGDARGKCVFLNSALRRFWGVDPADLGQFEWATTVHPDDVDVLAGPFAEAMAAQAPFSVEARYRRADGEYRTMRTEANPRWSIDGAFLGMTGVNTDVTDQLLAEEHSQLLMSELNHRTKNMLSVVQAVARQTARSTAAGEFLETFDARLQSLAASNDLLLRHDWSGVQLNELVEAQLAHLGEVVGTRLIVCGPPLRVSSQGAQTLGMALHELSTNSLKYGALSDPAGRVELSWERLDGSGWRIGWRETTSTPPVAPTRRGFGHTVIVNMVTATFGAEVEIEFAQSGFRWQAVVPQE